MEEDIEEELSILLVEDMPSDAQLTHIALRELDVPNRIERVRSGDDALDLLRNHPDETGQFDIVLLDLKLLGMDGVSFLTTAVAEGLVADVPVVVLTSSTLDSDIEASIAAGAAEVVEKAHDWDEWVRRLADLLERHTTASPTRR